MDSTEQKLTLEEVTAMFGGEIPIEAESLVWTADGSTTIGELRSQLQEMAQAARAKALPPGDVEKVIERLRYFDRNSMFGKPHLVEAADLLLTYTEDNKRLRSENDLLRDECGAKVLTISTMQGRIDWVYTQRDAAVASHEGQKRNTEAFMRERDEARAEIASLKEIIATREFNETEVRAEGYKHGWEDGRAEADASLKEALEVAVNSCGDVTKLGRFSRAVDPVRWVAQLEAHLRLALTNTQENKKEGR